jgi:hypothetical protein
MPKKSSLFRDAIISEILSWNENIEIKKDKAVGFRFVDTPRKLNIVLKCQDKYLGIETTIQEESGTTDEKLYYTLEDCKVCPIPTLIVFSGKGITTDIKSKLISLGAGLEVTYDEINNTIIDKNKLFRQRVYIELGLDWFKF